MRLTSYRSERGTDLGVEAMDLSQTFSDIARTSGDRFDVWHRTIDVLEARSVAEVGVFRGQFAERMLRGCRSIEQYYMIDPWTHLEDWNKPANVSDEKFSEIKHEALTRTSFASDKRTILQGRTSEVVSRIPDRHLDFVYVDGDHTLRGITIDLVSLWPKLRHGAILAGDDFSRTVWQHDRSYEPSLVFPFAVHFAEAQRSTIYGLPFDQFAIVVNKSSDSRSTFCDLTGDYESTDLRDALDAPDRTRATRRRVRLPRRASTVVRRLSQTVVMNYVR